MILGRIGAIWGLAGILAMLSFAIYRLTGIAFDAFGYPFAWWHWLLLVTNTAFMAHSEGYKGFQKSFSPRVVARAQSLIENPRPLRILLAPLFCMGYFATTRRRLLSAYALTAGIFVLVWLFHQLDQPLRGVLDVGVAVGLTWGALSLVAIWVQSAGSPRISQ